MRQLLGQQRKAEGEMCEEEEEATLSLRARTRRVRLWCVLWRHLYGCVVVKRVKEGCARYMTS